MREKVALPIGCVVTGTSLLLVGWLTGLPLVAAGIGCVLGGMFTLAWRTGRHYQCG